MKHALIVKNIKKSYGSIKAVNDISFSIPQGSCFGLLGPNGAGKTTTLEIIEHIIKADSGIIDYPLKPKNLSLQSHIGIQFQHTALQDFLTVEEALVMFTTLYQNDSQLEQLVEICALEDIMKQDVKKLSGGQRQRVLLALALIHNPDVVFLDEPTTGLDPQSRRNFWQLINQIKQQGKTIVLTTHYMDEAEQLCDEIAIVDHGTIIEQGSPRDLLHKHFDGSFIELPITIADDLRMISASFETISDTIIRMTSNNVESDLQFLINNKISLEGLYIHHPNLDDLFIKLTGHELRC